MCLLISWLNLFLITYPTNECLFTHPKLSLQQLPAIFGTYLSALLRTFFLYKVEFKMIQSRITRSLHILQQIKHKNYLYFNGPFKNVLQN